MSATETTQTFFDAYAQALLDRDAAAIAQLYAVPSLILFPGQSIAVTSVEQTEQFFASSFEQYHGVSEAHSDITVVAEAEHSLWADVTWTYGGERRERFIYQLVRADDVWTIAVLTPTSL
ncbi:nuclear transport factor 2 family protein [Paramicrobacterium chengjingii]|uniref:Nuclear transport factor 2 family protein n=1 Tax=Paramicrobacterium chengjingii TaxID=2769067 RepID=A0ABX6YJ78_9MICO|nr:nuclear transport factor 2 family protein [Microbacterium chengjingii]QPZ38402.1 nuclear transport factor 2 family protein [Microbacterium chengjingii]